MSGTVRRGERCGGPSTKAAEDLLWHLLRHACSAGLERQLAASRGCYRIWGCARALLVPAFVCCGLARCPCGTRKDDMAANARASSYVALTTEAMDLVPPGLYAGVVATLRSDLRERDGRFS